MQGEPNIDSHENAGFSIKTIQLSASTPDFSTVMVIAVWFISGVSSSSSSLLLLLLIGYFGGERGAKKGGYFEHSETRNLQARSSGERTADSAPEAGGRNIPAYVFRWLRIGPLTATVGGEAQQPKGYLAIKRRWRERKESLGFVSLEGYYCPQRQ